MLLIQYCSLKTLVNCFLILFKSNIGFCAASNSKSSSGSTTFTLLRFVSKPFFLQRWVRDPFYASIYMKDKWIQSVPVMNVRGNRFNDLFCNAAGTFYLASRLVQFFENSKSTLSFTHRYILKALKDDRILALCRALGIRSKINTEPYLNRASDESSTALSMGDVYNRLIDLLILNVLKNTHL